MNLRDLQYLVAVATHLNFGKAAEACHVSQPTLSMQLKKLEEYLGVPLFERTNKHVMPTAHGLEIIKKAQTILTEANDIKAYAQSVRDPLAGDFHLGAFPTIAPYFLPKAVPLITQALPRLQLFLSEDKSPVLMETLLDGHIDAAILALPIEHDALSSLPLFEDPFFLAVPAAHPLANRPSVAMEDLRNETLLLLEDGHCLRSQALQVCHLSGAKETEGFRATSLETLRHMVMAGSGITLIPRIAIPTAPETSIAYIPFANDPPSRTIGLVWRKSSHRVQLLEELAKLIKSR